MINKKDSPFVFEIQDSQEMISALDEIMDICNKLRGSDTDLDTPYKYFKNHIFYSLKEITELYQEYIMFIHGISDLSYSTPQELSQHLKHIISWSIKTIKLFRYSEQFEFLMRFRSITSNDSIKKK